MEYLMVATMKGKNLVKMVAIGVGDEYLTEIGRAHYLNNALHTTCIQLVEDIVEKEKRGGMGGGALEEVKLCQLERDGKRLVLTLAALALHLMTSKSEDKVVAVDSMQGIAHGTVLMAVATDDLVERTAAAMALITDIDLLKPPGDGLMIMTEHGNEFIDKGATDGMDALALMSHLLLEDVKKGGIGLVVLLQQGVALLKGLGIAGEMVDIAAVVLGDDHVHQATALLTRAVDEKGVGGGHHHYRYQTNMLRQATIFLAIALEMLLAAALHTTIHQLRLTIVGQIATLKHENVLAVAYHIGIERGDTAAAKGKIVDGIKYIGLANTILSDKTIHLRRKVKGHL